jgi:hypothetical protein
MARFGYFTGTGVGIGPVEEFEGDYLNMDKQFVQVCKIDPAGRTADKIVASIHLDKGQYIKEIRD